jgi:hypothetical protein
VGGLMRFLILLALFVFVGSFSRADQALYQCTLKIHCSELHEDQKVVFSYQAGPAKKEPKTVDLGVVRARVYGPSYLSLYLFDTRHPQTIWTKTHSNSLVNDLEISLVIPEDETHSMVANLRCEKQS